MSTEEFLFRIAADTKELREELKKARAETDKFSDKMDTANEKGLSLNTSLTNVASGVGLVASSIAAATAAFTAYATAQGRSIRDTEAMATAAGLSVEEFRKMSFIMGTVGIEADSVGSIFGDAQEKIGDFLNTGGGGFQDFIDTMGYTKEQATALAKEFEHLSGQEVLQEMVNRMEDAGVSSQRMNHALEGMAGDARLLIPLLKENGAQAAALGETFDSVNVPLSDEERAQFKALADNVDLAQTSFVNFLNNAISPFLPAINAAATALSEFFATASTKFDLDRIVEDNELAKQIDTLTEIDRLEDSINEKLEKQKNARKLGRPGDVSEKLEAKYQAAADAIAAQRIAIEERNKAEQEALELESKKGTLKSQTGGATIGADGIDLKQQLLDELAAREEAKKSALTLLQEERDERYAILKSMYEDENALSAEMKQQKEDRAAQIEAAYLEQAREIAKTQDEKRLEAAEKELAGLAELLEAKLVTQEAYEEKRKEIIAEYDPTSIDPEALEEKNQLELEMLQEKLDNQLISYADYFEKLAVLQKQDAEDKKKKSDLENWWSESSTKKQMDLGTTLLTSLGNNSKKAHKIKQGLASANVVMTTAENITEQYPNALGMIAAGVVGATQLSAILSSTPDGSSSIAASSAPDTGGTDESTYNEQTTTVTDITDGVNEQQILRIDFGDEIIDAVAMRVSKSKSDGRT